MSRKTMLALVSIAVGLTVVASTAIAGHITSGVKSYAGCLTPGDGPVIKIKEGNAPSSACTGGQVQVHFSGGDITAISAQTGGGLSGGGDNGAVSLSIRRDCGSGQILKWNGSAWACSDDSNSMYTAGTGLDLNGSAFSVEDGYRLPQSCASGEAATRNPASGGGAATWTCEQFVTADQGCASGQFARGVTAVGALSCAAPASGSGVQAYSGSAGSVTLAGTTSVISKPMPAGTYLLLAQVTLQNQDLGDTSQGSCSIPGDVTETLTLDTRAELTLMSVTSHPGGAVVLECTESEANIDVAYAGLAAIKLDSLG